MYVRTPADGLLRSEGIIHSEDFSIISMLSESSTTMRTTFFVIILAVGKFSGRLECLMCGFSYNFVGRLGIFWMSEGKMNGSGRAMNTDRESRS